MTNEIVPVALGLTRGDLFTLWAPRWQEDGDEWEAFLGLEDDLYGFGSVPELVAFIRTAGEHDLDDHPAWDRTLGEPVIAFEPGDDDSHDLVGIPDLLRRPPTEESAKELQNAFEVVRALGSVCELDELTEFGGIPVVAEVITEGYDAVYGKIGARVWERLAVVVLDRWDAVLDALDELIVTPALPAAAREALPGLVEEYEEALEDLTGDDAETDDSGDDDLDDDFWDGVGIDPVKILTDDATWFTLRCFLGDDPVFLGRDGDILVFPSERALTRFLVDDTDHDLVSLSTYEDVTVAANSGDLEITVHPENTYALTGLASAIAQGPTAIDPARLELAVELILDAADYADDPAAAAALGPNTVIGRFVEYVTNPDSAKLAPGEPFTEESREWAALVEALEERFVEP